MNSTSAQAASAARTLQTQAVLARIDVALQGAPLRPMAASSVPAQPFVLYIDEAAAVIAQLEAEHPGMSWMDALMHARGPQTGRRVEWLGSAAADAGVLPAANAQ